MLIVICGKSGTGKSSVAKEIMKMGYKRVVTDTTRPPRKGEENGVDYYFDTEEQFNELLEEGEFLETTAYKVASGDIWSYGTTIGAVKEAPENAVIILNPMGVKAFRGRGIKGVYVLIDSNEKLIFDRLTDRGDFKAEILRRIDTDNRDFEDIHQYIDATVYNEKNTDIVSLAKSIVNIAKEHEEINQ